MWRRSSLRSSSAACHFLIRGLSVLVRSCLLTYSSIPLVIRAPFQGFLPLRCKHEPGVIQLSSYFIRPRTCLCNRATSFLFIRFSQSILHFPVHALRMPQKVVIVGAGPVGSLAALYAAVRGHDVEIYELRPGELPPRTMWAFLLML